MATPGEDGGGETRPQRVPRRIVALAGHRIGSGPPYGPLAVAAAALRLARVPQSPPDRIPQLPHVAHCRRPQSASTRRTLTLAHHHPRSQNYLNSRSALESKGTRGEHHQRTPDGVGAMLQ